MDIFFINPQDLLALSIAICAWRFAKVKRLSRSEILKEYSTHWQERPEGDEALESKASAGDGARSRPDNPPACIGWKKKKREAFQKLKSNTTSHKRGYIYKNMGLLNEVLGLHATKEFATSE
jgi:hypothetical protein